MRATSMDEEVLRKTDEIATSDDNGFQSQTRTNDRR